MQDMQKEMKDADLKKVCHMIEKHVKKRKKKKDAYPKKVCHMLARHVKKKEKKRKEKDSPHPWKIKKRDGSCKGVHPPSKKSHTLAHLDQSV